MFDVGFWELVLIFGIGLMILGPEKLPRVANQIGRWVGKARRTAGELRRQLERELDFDDLTGGPKKYSRPKPPPPPSSASPEPPVTDHMPSDDLDIDPASDPEPSAEDLSTTAIEDEVHEPQEESPEPDSAVSSKPG